MIILGLDSGLHHTGWGIINHTALGSGYHANGVVHTKPAHHIEQRLSTLYQGLCQVIEQYRPHTTLSYSSVLSSLRLSI